MDKSQRHLVSSADLKHSHLPSTQEGWSLRAIKFALTFDGYAHVNGGPQELNALIMEPMWRAYAETGHLPDMSVDDLRAVLFYMQREDYFQGGHEFSAEELDLYGAVLERLRGLLPGR